MEKKGWREAMSEVYDKNGVGPGDKRRIRAFKEMKDIEKAATVTDFLTVLGENMAIRSLQPPSEATEFEDRHAR